MPDLMACGHVSWMIRRLPSIPLVQPGLLLEGYRPGRIVVADPRLRRLRVTGVFDLADPEAARVRIAEGQAHVSERFSPARISESWAQALGI